MWRIFALWLCTGLATSALIFPLLPTPDGSYDGQFNLLRSYNAVWETNHHAVYNIGPLNAVGVAPHWLLTAEHVAVQLNTNNFVNDDTARYYVQETVDLGNDLALVRVDKPLPFYSRITKFPGGGGDILTVYGQSGTPIEPIRDLNATPKGWKFGPLTHEQGLRWGMGRRLATPPTTIQWDFTTGDGALGNGGLNCAAVNTNDSGGGIFVQDAVEGIITGLVAQGFRFSRDEPQTVECDLNPLGHVFDPSTFYRCTSDNGNHPITRAYGAPIFYALSNVFAHISPPIRINAGGALLSENGQTWEAGVCDGCGAYLDQSSEAINVSAVTDPAPQGVYKSVAYIHAQPTGALTFALRDLIRYEKYKVRLHFASIFPADSAEASTERVIVNGVTNVIDPFKGVRKGSVLSFEQVSPDPNSMIQIRIEPANPGGNATVSGIEAMLYPLTPQEAPNLKWDIASYYPVIDHLPGVAYANGSFFASGRLPLISVDNGGTWQPTTVPAGSDIEAVNGLFFAMSPAGESPTVSSSADGKTWQGLLDGPTPYVGGAYGNGRYVFARTDGAVALSTDGQNWQVSEGALPNTFGSPVFGNGRFVVMGNKVVFTSVNGEQWEQSAMDLPTLDPTCETNCLKWGVLGNIRFGNGKFVTYGPYAINPVLFPTISAEFPLISSLDGMHWNFASDTLLTNKIDNGLVYLNGQFIYLPSHMFSSDLSKWYPFNFPLLPKEDVSRRGSEIPTAAAFGNSHYVFVDRFSATQIPYPSPPIARGPDLQSLERMDHPLASGSRSHVLTVGRTMMIVNPYPGFPLPLLVSTNSGASFVTAELPPDSRHLLAIASGDGQFVTVGERGVILRSLDGLRWTRSGNTSSADLYAVTFGNSRWMAVGTNGVVLTSRTAEAFQPMPSRTSVSLNSVAYGGSGFVAVGDSGMVASSRDGGEWLVQKVQETDFYSVTYGGGTYVAVGTNGLAQVSSDTITWSLSHPTGYTLRDVIYANGFFMTVDNNNPPNGFLSSDGVAWAMVSVPNGTVSLSASEDELWFSGFSSTNFVGKMRLRDPVITLFAGRETEKPALSFNAPIEGSYTISSAPDLLSSNWTSEAVLRRGNSDWINWESTNEVSGTRFFRVRTE